jgi:serine/threonine protein kinase
MLACQHAEQRAAPDQYTILQPLHAGATATLYRGVRKRDGWPVIMKVLHTEPPAPRDVERLCREYEIGRQIDSPYVIKPYDLETHGSQLWLIAEDCGGAPLSLWLGVPLEPGRFLDIAIQLAKALADIHAQGIVHKDLKPANILLHPHTGAVQLTDFGIAAPLVRAPTATSRPSLIEGSLAYMSPEQTGRMHRVIDHRSDLYSLGVTFYEMLTGVAVAAPDGGGDTGADCRHRHEVVGQAGRGALPERPRAPLRLAALPRAVGLQRTHGTVLTWRI